MATIEQREAATIAYARGWREDADGNWQRPGTRYDALTLHPAEEDPDDRDSEFGYVVAEDPIDALRIDRETFGWFPAPGDLDKLIEAGV